MRGCGNSRPYYSCERTYMYNKINLECKWSCKHIAAPCKPADCVHVCNQAGEENALLPVLRLHNHAHALTEKYGWPLSLSKHATSSQDAGRKLPMPHIGHTVNMLILNTFTCTSFLSKPKADTPGFPMRPLLHSFPGIQHSFPY